MEHFWANVHKQGGLWKDTRSLRGEGKWLPLSGPRFPHLLCEGIRLGLYIFFHFLPAKQGCCMFTFPKERLDKQDEREQEREGHW